MLLNLHLIQVFVPFTHSPAHPFTAVYGFGVEALAFFPAQFSVSNLISLLDLPAHIGYGGIALELDLQFHEPLFKIGSRSPCECELLTYIPSSKHLNRRWGAVKSS